MLNIFLTVTVLFKLKIMTKTIKIYGHLLWWFFAGSILITSCQQNKKKPAQQAAAKSQVYYTCSMHPHVHEDHPGNCPICGMKLIKVEITGNSMNNRITLTAVQLQLGGIQTDTVREENTGDEKTITGTVTNDENSAKELSARLSGRIQHLYVRTIGEQIKAGESVYSIYSEDLQEAEKEYLLARDLQKKLHNPDVDYQSLIGAAENKLKLWGLTAAQISGLARSEKVSATTAILSTVNGTVSELNVHEGDYVTEGMTILKTQSLGSLWVEAQLYAGESGILQLNQQVRVVFPDQGLTVNGKVAFLNPELSDESKVDLVRIAISNPSEQIRPGMQAYVSIGAREHNLAVPASAILTDGKGSYVWIRNKDNSFSPRAIETGERNRSFVQILSGLSMKEIVVTKGAYLLNSEAIFKNGQAMGGMKM